MSNVAFSRMQLAAALLEYDNDPDNPDAPYRSAQESAIFAHVKQKMGVGGGGRSSNYAASRVSTDYLGVALPSDAGDILDETKTHEPTETAQSGHQTRRSRSSINALKNPFGGDDEEEEGEEEVPDVDLASWGLDSFMPKEKGSRSKRTKSMASSALPNPHLPTAKDWENIFEENRPRHSRAMSMLDFGAGGAFLDSSSGAPTRQNSFRRNSIANPLDMGPRNASRDRDMARRRNSTHALIESLPVTPPLHTVPLRPSSTEPIPFPSSSAGADGASIAGSRMDEYARVQRRLSTNTLGTMGTTSKGLEGEKDLFMIPPPPPSRASRFDPKVQEHIRTLSNNTMLSAIPRQEPMPDDDDENVDPDARPRSRGSVLDPQTARQRRISRGTIGTRDMLIDDDFQSVMTGDPRRPHMGHERRYSRLDLMRPKVLIMPSPLQQITEPPQEPSLKAGRDGFLLSTDGPPLPPGARSSRTLSTLGPSTSHNIPVASNSFTPNPRLSLSASQLLFRNNLLVDGKRDVAYHDIDSRVKRAAEEGEQVELEEPEEPAPPPPPPPAAPTEADASTVLLEEDIKPRRPPGKLFGRSLIDDLEARKAVMKGKKRVFTGDQRPSMMSRAQPQRSSTFIDQATLMQRPPTTFGAPNAPNEDLQRRGSRNSKPLLNFDDEGGLGVPGARPDSSMPRMKSVFGVDKLWETEMAKLKEIEAQEKLEAEERAKREAELEEMEERMGKKKKKGKKGKKGKGKDAEQTEEATPSPSLPQTTEVTPAASATSLPFVLPDVQPVSTRRRTTAPPPVDDDSDDESSASDVPGPSVHSRKLEGWQSDEDLPAGPIKTTGVGLRNPRRQQSSQFSVPKSQPAAADSDEDVPLSVAVQRATMLGALRPPADDSEDEDKPISALIVKAKSEALSDGASRIQSAAGAGVEDDEDNKPLGLRASRMPSIFAASQAGGDEDEDDRPLAMHPQQQRKTQFQMLAAQQQMMFEAQMRNTMMFGMQPPMMGPPMNPLNPMNPMMMSQATFAAPIAAPPPVQDTQKFGRVDKWRHDVAVEGSDAA